MSGRHSAEEQHRSVPQIRCAFIVNHNFHCGGNDQLQSINEMLFMEIGYPILAV